jgi:hypothetical protein
MSGRWPARLPWLLPPARALAGPCLQALSAPAGLAGTTGLGAAWRVRSRELRLPRAGGPGCGSGRPGGRVPMRNTNR